jgi:cytochrome c peroxidase
MNRTIIYLLIVIAAVLGFIFTGNDTQENAEILVENQSDVVMQAKLDPHEWSSAELGILQSLSLDNLPTLPPDASNAVADNAVAANFGHQLFFDVRLSSNGEVSCASCHKPELKFTDGLPRAKGVGVTPRKSMTVIGTAYSPWLFWDGRKDSQWSQALGPLESPVEHGANRTYYVHIIANDESYRGQYESLFGEIPDISDASRFPPSAGPVPDPIAKAAWDSMAPEDKKVINRVFVNLGKSIAAYERLLLPGKSRFDDYVESALSNNRQQLEVLFSESEARGLDVFVGKAQCINCHNGPLLTNNAFHNTGIPPALDLPPDFGRIEGVYTVKEDPFNCLGEYSDEDQEQCEDLIYTRTEGQEIIAAFKTPTLRNVTQTSPYMHSGQIPNLTEVIRHYNAAPLAVRGHSELAAIDLTTDEMRALEDFLHTLSSPVDVPAEYLESPWPEVSEVTIDR